MLLRKFCRCLFAVGLCTGLIASTGNAAIQYDLTGSPTTPAQTVTVNGGIFSQFEVAGTGHVGVVVAVIAAEYP